MLTHTGEGIDDSAADPYRGDRQILRPGDCVCVRGSSMMSKLRE